MIQSSPRLPTRRISIVEDEGDDLVAGRARHPGADREIRGAEQKGAEVAADDRPGVGLADDATLIGKGIVSITARAMIASAARNLPTTASQSRTGNVIRSSMVPSFISSDQSRIAIAGTKKISMIDIRPKKSRRSACPMTRNPVAQKSRPCSRTRNTVMKM